MGCGQWDSPPPLAGHSDQVNSVAFSPDGRYALTGSMDRTAILWDVASGTALHTLAGHADQVYSVAFSPDGRYALTGSFDHTAILWDVASGTTLHALAGHTDAVVSAAFSPDSLTGSGTERPSCGM